MRNQTGQVAIIILLFLLVALTIALVATQRSLTNITTSSESEQSSRAFSAAEAGIQKAIETIPVVTGGPNPSASPVSESELGNSSSGVVTVVNNLPRIGEALEYPPIGKDTIAQFWLANPTNTTSTWNAGTGNFNDPHFAYSQSSVRIYYGNANPVSTPAPAIEINLVTQDSSSAFVSHRYFVDNPALSRLAANNFTSVTAGIPGASPGNCSPGLIHTSSSITPTAVDKQFYCMIPVPIPSGEVPILIRARIVYSDAKEPIAVEPIGGCGPDCSLPPQAAIYTARGFSGQSQKTLQVFRQPFYLSPLLDFALFSAGPITK